MKLSVIHTMVFLVSLLSAAASSANIVNVDENQQGVTVSSSALDASADADAEVAGDIGRDGGLRRLATTPIKFFSVLSRAQNVDSCTSTANGMGNAVYTYVNSKLCMRLGYGGLSGAEIASHIHGPGNIGVAGGVIFSITSTSSVKNQCFTLTAAQATLLLAGSLYVNIHTAKCPNGEIRGQIMRAVA